MYPITSIQEQQAESLVQLSHEGIQYADKRCRQLFRSQIAFTPKYKELIEAVHFWKLVLCKKQGRKVSTKLMGRITKKAKQQIPLKKIRRMASRVIQQKLQESYQRYQTYCQDSLQSRTTCRKLVPVGSIAVDKSLVAGIEVCLQNKLPIIKA